MKIIKNPNKTEYDAAYIAVFNNEGYCPCALEKLPETKCPCKEFLKNSPLGKCNCGKYIKLEF